MPESNAPLRLLLGAKAEAKRFTWREGKCHEGELGWERAGLMHGTRLRE